MIHFAVCDDDQATVSELDSLIKALEPLYNQEFEISDFSSGESFCKHLNESSDVFDIVLMDIEMRGITGIEAGKKLRENIASDQTLLIFVSGHENYFRELIDLNVFKFIHKPIITDVFNLKIGGAIQKVLRQRQSPAITNFSIKINRNEIQVPVNSIMYLESDAKKIHVYTTDNTYTYYGKLDKAEAELPSHAFSRVHHSYLINFSHAVSVNPKSVTMKNKCRLSISEKYREKVKKAYIRYRGNGK